MYILPCFHLPSIPKLDRPSTMLPQIKESIVFVINHIQKGNPSFLHFHLFSENNAIRMKNRFRKVYGYVRHPMAMFLVGRGRKKKVSSIRWLPEGVPVYHRGNTVH